MWACYDSFFIVIISSKKSTQKGVATVFHLLKGFPGKKGLNFSLGTSCCRLKRALPSLIHPLPGCWAHFPLDGLQPWHFHGPQSMATVPEVQPFTVGLWHPLGIWRPPTASRPHPSSSARVRWATLGPCSQQVPFLQLCQQPFQDLDQNPSPPRSFLGALHAWRQADAPGCTWACLLGFPFPH